MSDTSAWTETHRALEAILLVADEPADAQLLAQLLEVPPARVEELCAELRARYEVDGHGFVLAKVAGGWRYQTAPDLAAYVERFALEGQSARMSAAALETLAIVAYKQPLSRAQIGAIRGVNVDGVMRRVRAERRGRRGARAGPAHHARRRHRGRGRYRGGERRCPSRRWMTSPRASACRRSSLASGSGRGASPRT
jgi:chromosome segregation and condensation protein ScpB